MKKIILLIISLFIITGCTATYELDISDINNISEKLVINDNSVTKEQVENMYPDLLTDFTIIVDDDDIDSIDESVPRYNKLIDENNGVSRITYSYDKFNLKNIKNSNIAKTGFNNVGVVNDEERIQISTNDVLKAFDEYKTLNSLIISINCPYKVLETNADSVSNTRYTWKFDKQNYNKSVVLVVDKKDFNENQKEYIKQEEQEENKEEKEKTPIWVILVGVLGFLVVLFIVITFKSRVN